MTPFDVPAPTIPRDRFDRPLVIPPQGGKPVPYTRCTTFVDCLEDKFNLQQWELRQAVLGIAERPDLLLAVSAHRDDKKELNRIVKQAKEYALTSARATTGTALHRLCERADRGERVGTMPATALADVRAYLAVTAEMEHRYIEHFGVHDGFQIGGTPDRVSLFRGRFYIVDIKTGSDISWGALKIAMQLAVYARSVLYGPTEGRSRYPFEVDQERAIVIHLPAGGGHATLYFVDITRGWAAVEIAAQVREYRAIKDWYTPIEVPEPPPAAALPTISEQIAQASTVEQLRQVWVGAIAAGTWRTEQHVPQAKARRAELEKVAS